DVSGRSAGGAGIYVFAQDFGPFSAALYVGHSDNLRDDLQGREMWAAAQRLGATKIDVLRVADVKERKLITSDLVVGLQPLLNQKSRLKMARR
ncbi:MAG: hypothetical protein ABWZ40_05335, partial [Caulobacterales bacterium]